MNNYEDSSLWETAFAAPGDGRFGDERNFFRQECWLQSNAPTAYKVMPPLARLTIHFYPATQYNPIPPPRKNSAGCSGLLPASPRSNRQGSTRRKSGKVPHSR